MEYGLEITKDKGEINEEEVRNLGNRIESDINKETLKELGRKMIKGNSPFILKRDLEEIKNSKNQTFDQTFNSYGIWFCGYGERFNASDVAQLITSNGYSIVNSKIKNF